jgi:triacylglycerol lipase
MTPPLTFDLGLARACVAASARAYADVPKVESDLAHVVIGSLLRARMDDTFGEVAENVLVVAFRGTASLHDFVTDLDALKMRVAIPGPRWNRDGGGEAHRGFVEALGTIVFELIDQLGLGTGRSLNAVCPRIVLTGHSLGGALALLAAPMLRGAARRVWPEAEPIEAVYTFGQPRVGDARFARSYDSQFKYGTWRFVNEEDPVPRLPGVLAGFRHCGNEAFFPSIGSAPIINPSLATKLISDAWGFYREWKQGGPLQCLADHRVAEYLKRLSVGQGSQSLVTSSPTNK